jgi:hypothetical protein
MESHHVALEFPREGQRHQFAEPPNDLAAKKAYRSATRTAPEWGEPYHWLGAVLESQGRQKKQSRHTNKQSACCLMTRGISSRLAGCKLLADITRRLSAYWRRACEETSLRRGRCQAVSGGSVGAFWSSEEAFAQWQVVLRIEPSYPSHHRLMEEAKRTKAHSPISAQCPWRIFYIRGQRNSSTMSSDWHAPTPNLSPRCDWSAVSIRWRPDRATTVPGTVPAEL